MADMQAAPEQGGGGFADGLAQLDKYAAAVAAAVEQNAQVPDELKAQAMSVREAVAGLAEGLVNFASGGGAQGPASGPQGAVSPEQGGSSGAVPESMGARR